jgi:hypothetical protein
LHAAAPNTTGTSTVAKEGDFVAVDYTGTLDDGEVFDTSRKEGRKPLEFKIGGGTVGVSPDVMLPRLLHGRHASALEWHTHASFPFPSRSSKALTWL